MWSKFCFLAFVLFYFGAIARGHKLPSNFYDDEPLTKTVKLIRACIAFHDTIPNYYLEKVIGSGTFGIVFKARHSTGNVVALKLSHLKHEHADEVNNEVAAFTVFSV